MAVLTTQYPTINGTTITYSAASGGGDTFVPGPGVYLRVKNTDSSPHNALIARGHTDIGGVSLGNFTVTVTNATEVEAGPFTSQEFLNVTNGNCAVTYSSTTGMTIAVVSK